MRIKREVKGIIFLVLIFIILFALFIIVYTSLKTDPVNENIQKDAVIKLLFVMEDKSEVLFTDLLIYYPVTGKGALVSIPGNTGSIYETLGRVDRIDSIYKEKGIDVYKEEIEDLVGMPLPYYVKASLDDFVKLSDLLGGMDVFIPSSIEAKSEDGEDWLLPSGAVNLDGDKIRTYITYKIDDESGEDVKDRKQRDRKSVV